MKSRFEMDAAVYLEPEDGNVVVRHKKVRNVILLVVLGLAGIGVLALAPSIFRDIQRDETTLWGAMDQILTAEQQDGEEIEIGTVSGSKMKQRAEGIARLIKRRYVPGGLTAPVLALVAGYLIWLLLLGK